MDTPALFEAKSTQPDVPSLFLTEAAITRLRDLFKKKGAHTPHYLHIQVDAGGCAGFTYLLNLVDSVPEDTTLLSYEDVSLVLDEASLDILKGSTLDYATSLMGAAFSLKNPAATASCGCGTSFSIF